MAREVQASGNGGHKMKPKVIICPPDADRSGIQVRFTKASQSLNISGWYDTFVGIEPTTISLRDFLKQLGITEAQCRKALAETEAK